VQATVQAPAVASPMDSGPSSSFRAARSVSPLAPISPLLADDWFRPLVKYRERMLSESSFERAQYSVTALRSIDLPPPYVANSVYALHFQGLVMRKSGDDWPVVHTISSDAWDTLATSYREFVRSSGSWYFRASSRSR